MGQASSCTEKHSSKNKLVISFPKYYIVISMHLKHAYQFFFVYPEFSLDPHTALVRSVRYRPISPSFPMAVHVRRNSCDIHQELPFHFSSASLELSTKLCTSPVRLSFRRISTSPQFRSAPHGCAHVKRFSDGRIFSGRAVSWTLFCLNDLGCAARYFIFALRCSFLSCKSIIASYTDHTDSVSVFLVLYCMYCGVVTFSLTQL